MTAIFSIRVRASSAVYFFSVILPVPKWKQANVNNLNMQRNQNHTFVHELKIIKTETEK